MIYCTWMKNKEINNLKMRIKMKKIIIFLKLIKNLNIKVKMISQ